MKCRGSGTLAHMQISFQGKSCPLCNLWAHFMKCKNDLHNLAGRMILLMKKQEDNR